MRRCELLDEGLERGALYSGLWMADKKNYAGSSPRLPTRRSHTKTHRGDLTKIAGSKDSRRARQRFAQAQPGPAGGSGFEANLLDALEGKGEIEYVLACGVVLVGDAQDARLGRRIGGHKKTRFL
jgi:hypothetical protein